LRRKEELGSVQSGPKWGGIYRECPSQLGRQKCAQTMVCAQLAGAQVGNLIPKLEIGGVYILWCFWARRASFFSLFSALSGFLYFTSTMVVPVLGYTLVLSLCYGSVLLFWTLPFLFLLLLCCPFVLVSTVTLTLYFFVFTDILIFMFIF